VDALYGCAEQPLELAIQRNMSLLLELARSCGEDLRLYLFGSVAQGSQNPDDLDVLAIYEREDSIQHFRDRTAEMNLALPLHLIAMTLFEEAFYQFIEHSKAERFVDSR
jgi:predicted nucleotidyltransferase